MMEQLMKKPTPVNEEVVWDKTKVIISTTDKFGTIIYANQTFLDVCEYSIEDVLGQPHNIIRHPDTPKLIFKVLWDNISAGRNFHAILKNISKSGKYYWVITDFEVDKNTDGNIVSYTARRRAVAENVIKEHIEPLYQTLLKLETIGGMDLSNRYFKGFLDKQGKSYIDYIMDIVGNDNETVYDYSNVGVTNNNSPFLAQEISDDIFSEERIETIKRKNFFSRLFSTN